MTETKIAKKPSYAFMINAALVALKEPRKGSSKQAIEKYIKAKWSLGDRAGIAIKLALKKGVEKGTFIQLKGKGASGSFKLAKPLKALKHAKKAAKKTVPKKTAIKKLPATKAKKATKKVVPKPSGAVAKKAKMAPAKKQPRSQQRKPLLKNQPLKRPLLSLPLQRKRRSKNL